MNYGVYVKFFFKGEWPALGAQRAAARSVGLTPLAKSPIATSFVPF